MPLNAGVDILIQPDTNAGPVLKVPEENLKWTWDKKKEYREPEDQVDGLDHHLLHLLTAAVRHAFELWKWNMGFIKGIDWMAI